MDDLLLCFFTQKSMTNINTRYLGSRILRNCGRQTCDISLADRILSKFLPTPHGINGPTNSRFSSFYINIGVMGRFWKQKGSKRIVATCSYWHRMVR